MLSHVVCRRNREVLWEIISVHISKLMEILVLSTSIVISSRISQTDRSTLWVWRLYTCIYNVKKKPWPRMANVKKESDKTQTLLILIICIRYAHQRELNRCNSFQVTSFIYPYYKIYLILNLLNILNWIIHLPFLGLFFIIFMDIKMRTRSKSAYSIEPGQTAWVCKLAWLYTGGKD